MSEEKQLKLGMTPQEVYEAKVKLPQGGNVIVFFHALDDFDTQALGRVAEGVSKPTQSKDFEVLADEEVSTPLPKLKEEIPLGEKIRIARKSLGISQKELAELLGVSTQTIGNWERGKSQPQPKYHQPIHQFLAKSPGFRPNK